MSDLTEVIQDAVNDSINDVEVDTPDVDVSADASPEPVEASESVSDVEPVAEAAPSAEVASPANVEAPEASSDDPQDPFSKLVGMPQVGIGGRENRIPYSRVKKISEKSANDAESRLAEVVLGRKLNTGEKALDVVKAHVAQIPELHTKVTDYESRLENVGRFENIMENDPEQFLTMLSKLPAYKSFFEFVDNALAQGQEPAKAQAAPATSAAEAGMPEPDDTLEDGSKVYSMEGLKSLLAWNAQQTEARVTSAYETKLKALEAQFGPVASAWQEQQRIDATLPVIRKQLAEAETWPLFKESEDEILNVLKNDKRISLEGAYRQVVFPKLVAERNKVRQDVIKEAQAAPVSTSVSSRAAASKPVAPTAGSRSLEDIIKDSVASLKR